MSRRRIRTTPKDIPNYAGDMEAASLPSPSTNAQFRHVHEEIVVLENIARVFVAIAAERVSNGALISWAKFVNEATPHRKISSDEELEKFIFSKLSGQGRTARLRTGLSKAEADELVDEIHQNLGS